MTEKTKQVKEHTRRMKNGKVVKVRQHTAKYDAAEEEAKAASKKEGAGEEFTTHKKVLRSRVGSVCETMGVSEDDFAHWFEGDGSDADKRAAEQMRKFFGEAMYNKISDAAADSYGNGISAFVSRNKDAQAAFNLAGHTKSFGTTPAEFSEWYEGTGSKADKHCEKAMRERLGDAAYEEFSNYAADHYRKGNELSMASRITTSMGYGKTLDGTPVGKANPAPSKESSENTKKESKGHSEAVLYHHFAQAYAEAGNLSNGRDFRDMQEEQASIITQAKSLGLDTDTLQTYVKGMYDWSKEGYIPRKDKDAAQQLIGLKQAKGFTPTLSNGLQMEKTFRSLKSLEDFAQRLEKDGWKKVKSSHDFGQMGSSNETIYSSPDGKLQYRSACTLSGIGNSYYGTFRTARELPRKEGALEKYWEAPKPTKQITATKNGKPINITFKGE